MGCNCNKQGSIPLSVKKEMRNKLKERIADVKKIWNESKSNSSNNSSGSVKVTKDELGFK